MNSKPDPFETGDKWEDKRVATKTDLPGNGMKCSTRFRIGIGTRSNRSASAFRESQKPPCPCWSILARTGQSATKCRCLRTLRKLEHPSNEVIDGILTVLSDPMTGTGNRHRAGFVLGGYQSRSAYIVPRLIALLIKDNETQREAAVFALGRVGPAAKDALPALETLQSDASGKLAAKLKKAIAAIR